MNILSLFDGISCGRVALERANIEVNNYYSSEIDKYALSISNKNYPTNIFLGDVTNWRRWDIDWESIDLVFAGFPCFRKKTLVNTFNGLKEIQDIKINDLVLTHKNRYRKVRNTFINRPNVFYKLKTVGSLELEVTEEHPFFVRNRYKKRNNLVKFKKPEWKSLGILSIDDYIGMPILKTKALPEWKGISSICNKSTTTLKNDLNPLFTNTNFWYFIGRFFGDGWTRIVKRKKRKNSYSYNTIICCGLTEFNELKNIFDKLPFRYCITKEKTVYKFIISNEELTIFLRRYGHKAENKNLGDLIHLPKKYLLSLINGYISADGHKVNDNVFKASSVSKKLIIDLQICWLKLYKQLATICFIKRPKKYKIEDRIVNQKDYYTIKFFKKKIKQNGILITRNYVWSKITKIEKTSIVEETYNFEVEEDNSYCVNNMISHNCQAWSVAGAQKGDKDKRGQLFWVMLDILKRVKKKNPNFIYLIENVRMKTDFEEYITKALSKVLPSINKYLINSALVSAQLRKRFYWTNIENVEQPKDRNIILSNILEDGAADQLKSYCIDASYYKGTNLKQYLSKKRRQVVFKSTKRIHQIRNSIGYRIYSTQGKAACLSASGGGLAGGGGSLIYDKNGVRKLTPLECERLQTLPDNYTAGVSNTQRYKCIGNGWTVEVVRHILETWKKNIDLIK